MKVLFYIAFLLMAVSCRTTKTVNRSGGETQIASQEKRDSLVYIERVKVDSIFLPSERIEVQIPVEVLKRDTVIVLQNGRSQTKLSSKDGQLNLETNCDELEGLVRMLETEFKYVSANSKSSEQIYAYWQEEFEKSQKQFDWLLIGVFIFGIAWGVFLTSIYFKTKKNNSWKERN